MSKISSFITLCATIIISITLLASTQAEGIYVANVRDCPPLTSRSSPVMSVHNLRPDDIKVVGALGDSVTAGAYIKGKDIPLFTNIFQEYRGLSYSIGGDEGAHTVPNFIKHYQPNVTGYSLGDHFIQHCTYQSCDQPYSPNLDVLNAAQSGATASNLDRELTYLIERMRTLNGISFDNDWKMINIQVGSNDMCQACGFFATDKGTPDNFAKDLEATINRIQADIPKVLVNVIGSYNITQLILATEEMKSYCGGFGSIPNKSECPCSNSQDGFEKMKQLFNDYENKMIGIYNKYQEIKNDTFTVVYQPNNVNFSSAAPEYFSNFDCFHPGVAGHNFLSKVIWNHLFLPQVSKPKVTNYFDYPESIYCPSDSDRIVTN